MEPLLPEGNIAEKVKCQSFAVTTFNIFVGPPIGKIDISRFSKLATVLQDECADMYCLQEVFSERVVELLKEKLSHEYHFLYGRNGLSRTLARYAAHVACCLLVFALVVATRRLVLLFSTSWIAGSLSALIVAILGFHCVLHAQRTVLWSFCFTGPAGGVLTMCRKDFGEVASNSFHAFDEQRGDFLNLVRKRGFLCTEIRVQGYLVTFLNMHTNAFPSISLLNAYPMPSLERQKQLRQGFAHAANSGHDGALIVVGDFNTTPELQEIPASEFGLESAWKIGDVCVTVPLTKALLQVFPATETDMCLDYQFSKGLKVEEAHVVQSGQISDHLPVRVAYQSPWAVVQVLN